MKKIGILIGTIFIIIIGYLTIRYITTDHYISVEDAKEIAMNDVANKDNNYKFNTIEYNNVNGNYIYILEFSDEVNLYTYKINAKTKKIISNKIESLLNNKSYMSEDDVLNIVYKHASISKSDSNLIANYVIIEDGIPIYNVVFYYSNIRYEYKVNALTGAVISVTRLNENK